jgi:hypothetical protein
MKSNLPTLLGQQDFMSSNWDIVKSARLEPLTNEQIEYNKRYSSISMRKITEYCPKQDYINYDDVFKLANAKIDQILRVRLPGDFKFTDRIKL